jgi:hypothetical protein
MTPSRRYLAVMLLVTVAGGALPARAETKPAEPRSWYGYQTFAADATAIALAYVAAETESDAAAVSAIGLYLVGAPTVHALHRRPLATAGSLGLRIGLPLLFSGLGGASADCSMPVVNDEGCDFGGNVMGLVVGMAMAVVLDSVAVAWERKATPAPVLDRPAAHVSSASARMTSLAPLPLRDGAGLLFSGRF